MKKLNNITKVVFLSVVLITISAICILINGNKYTYKTNLPLSVDSVDQVEIIIEDDIVKCTDIREKDRVLYLDLESIKEGKTNIEIKYSDSFATLVVFYVHNSGIITETYYIGNCSGSVMIPISITIVLSYILYLLIKKYKASINESLYQYQNIALLGIIIFVSFAIVNQIFETFNYHGLINTISTMINMFSGFSILLLPIAFITFIFVTITNIVLVKKEGFSIKKLLGLILGLMLCFMTIVPELLNNYLQTATWINVHNEQGVALYIQEFVELFIYVNITYLECVLLGTIIVALKSAKKIPRFDKDYIIILGCQIKKDGTLTNLLKGRVNRALEFSKMQQEKTGKELVFVPSGGQGDDEIISEAQAMKNYLMEQGIEEDRILLDDKSTNTFENIKYSSQVISNESAKVAFSTTNYHVFRAGNVAFEQGLNYEGIAAKTKAYFWINAFIREFIATLFSEKKKHILVVFGILAVSGVMIYLMYLAKL